MRLALQQTFTRRKSRRQRREKQRKGLALALHQFDEVGCRRSFERKTVANFLDDALLQRPNEMHARISPCDFGCVQVQISKLASSGEGLAILNDFGNNAPFVGRTRGKRSRVKQESFCTSGSRTVTPGGKDSIPVLCRR
jgi:hypothetical protein